MKNHRIQYAVLVTCALLLVTLSISYAQDSQDVFDLAITEIETQPFAAGIGDETSYFITIENNHSLPPPPQLILDLLLSVTNAQTDEVIAQCRQSLNFSLMSADHQAIRVPVKDCRVILQSPGTHLVRADLVESGANAENDGYSRITGDLDPSNNGALTTLVPVVSETDDGLPTEITRIFAGLAIFFAVMALVAAGAEVAIDSIKVAIGLKRKVTSMEALERMEKYLPGELAALSVSAATQEEFRRMIRELRGALGQTLQGVENVAALRAQIAASEFGTSFRRAEVLTSQQDNLPLTGRELYNFKKYLQAYITTVLNTLENRLHLPAASIRPLRDQLAQEISLFDGQGSPLFIQGLIDDLQNPDFWSTQIVDGWLNGKQDALYVQSSAGILEEFDSEIRPLLLGVGFKPASIESVRLELTSRLGIVEAGLSQSTDTFLESIRNVLDAVEHRRYDTQSPSRKIWRKLRGWQGGSFPPLRLRSTVMPSIYLALFLLFVAWLNGSTQSAPLGGSLVRIFGRLNEIPAAAWFAVFLLISFAAMLILFFVRGALGSRDRLWFTGLYGASALSLITGAVLTFLLWLLQANSVDRVTGNLRLLNWQQPWWSWLTIASLVIFFLLLSGSLIAKFIYDRLVRSAIRDGRLITNNNALGSATVIHRVETLWNLLRQGFDVTRVDPSRFSKPDTVADYEVGFRIPENPAFVFTPETAAQFIMQRSDQQRDEESSRLRILRVLSIIVGLLIAYSLQIDVLHMLGEAFPDVLDQLNWTIISGDALHAWRNWLPADKSITVGIVLTGFAASAGSAFWHDRLDQLQASKKGAQAAAQLLSQASQVANSTRNNG